MRTEVVLPATNRRIIVPASIYTCLISNDTYSQRGYEANVSTDLLCAPTETYVQMLAMLPDGYRMGALEETAYLIGAEKQLKAEGKNQREALKDALFDRFIKGNPYSWERTCAFFRAPKGAESLGAYQEDHDGKPYLRVDFGIGEKLVAEGVRLPKTRGDKVVTMNEALGIPAEVSNGNEPEHTMHLDVDENQREVAVDLGGYWFRGVDGKCLGFHALWGRSDSGEGATLRLVQGSLEELVLPSVEYFILPA